LASEVVGKRDKGPAGRQELIFLRRSANLDPPSLEKLPPESRQGWSCLSVVEKRGW